MTSRRVLAPLLPLVLALTLLGGPALPSGVAGQPAGATAVAAAPVSGGDALLRRIRRLDIVDSVQERPAPGKARFFRILVRLPVDHERPRGRSFLLRTTLTHVGTDRPMVAHTSGYGLWSWDTPLTSEVTRVVRGNQIDVEHRFFRPSIPKRPRWARQLTIRQSAADLHRVVRAFGRIYRRPWLTTGASKGGMTTTYHRRFYPRDVAGTIAYVAPNDAVDDEDVYDEFLGSVGGDRYATCRSRLVELQRRILEDRRWFGLRLQDYAADHRLTFRLVGSVDRAVEVAAIETSFVFWQYQPAADACTEVPRPSATRGAVWRWVDGVLGWWTVTDQSLRSYAPYYFQAATQLGAPAPHEEPLADLLRYPGLDVPASFVPERLRLPAFDPTAMAGVDAFVRNRGTRLLFVDGELDPWSAEPFDCGAGGAARECVRLVERGGNHGASLAGLARTDRRAAIRMVRDWAGLASSRSAVRRAEDRTAVAPSRERGARLAPYRR